MTRIATTWGLWTCLVLAAVGHAAAQDAEDLYQLKVRVDELRKAGRYAEAAATCEKVIPLVETLERDQPDSLATWLNNLAYLHKEAGNYDKIVKLYERSLEVSRSNFGEGNPNMAQQYDNLATAQWILGDFAKAELTFKRALSIAEKSPSRDGDLTSQVLNNLAILYQDQARYAEAEPLLVRSLLMSEREFGKNHLETAPNAENVGSLYADQGRFAEAEPLYRRALAIREANLPKGHPEIAKSLMKLAIMFSSQHRFAEAEPYFRRCLEIREQALGPEHKLVADTLNAWGYTYLNQGRPRDAEPLLRRALGIRQKKFGAEHAEVGQTTNNLARTLAELGRYEEAEPLHRRALEIREKTLGDSHPLVAFCLLDLARLKSHQGQDLEAEKFVNQSLEIREKTNLDPQDRFQCYEMRAQLHWKMNRKAEAIADLEKGLTLAEQARGQAAGGDTGRAALFASYAVAYERMFAWQLALGKMEDAFQTLERGRARSLMDQLTTANVDFLAGVPAEEAQELRERESEAQQNVAQIERQMEIARIDKNVTDEKREAVLQLFERELQIAREELIAAGVAIRNASPAYRQMVGQNFQPARVSQIQTELVGTGGLMLEYLLGDDAGYVIVIPAMDGNIQIEPLVVTKEQSEILKITAGPLTAARLRSALATEDGTGVLQLLRKPDAPKQLIDRLAVLYQVLIPENERKLLSSGKLEHWTIIPDATLAAFPFETLVVEKGEDMKFLLDVAPPSTTAPSATLLMNLLKVHTQEVRGVLSVGDVNYSAPAETGASRGGTSALRSLAAGARYSAYRGKLQPLPYTATESKWVTEAFKQAGIKTGSLLKQNAREASVRTFGSNYEILHLACHGLVDQGNGNLFGALALTPGPAGSTVAGDDGYLTLQEIYAMNLHGTRLAILSACDTNYGPQQRGEGVWSLSRGFLVAGAQRVVASNWLVDDEAAATLITAFCSSIAAGQKAGSVDYASSLHKAKRYIRDQEKWQSPYYWGTFVLVGPGK